MVKISTFAASLGAFLLVSKIHGHPGEHHDVEKVKRELEMTHRMASHAKRTLASCSTSSTSQALKDRSITRRAAIASQLRAEREIKTTMKHRRALADLEAYEKISHASNTSYTLDASESTIFSANTTYALTPETTIGPYWVLGENIRSNLTEGELGVAMHLEMQFVDINTCLPLSDLMIDIWSANATGVYSGISADEKEGGLNTTFLRGVQISDDEGVVQFDTLFPGHYEGRATHEHVVSHVNATLLPNGTYTGGTVDLIGQLFFDEALRAAVEGTVPYSENTAAVTTNDEDMWAPGEADVDYDPLPEYVMLGDDLSDGLLVWIVIGVDSSSNFTADAVYASIWGADGGVEDTSGSAVSGDGGGGGLNGTGSRNGSFSGTASGSLTASATVSACLIA